MKVTIYNIDGSELAMWHANLIYPPSFHNLPNHDTRCPYGISLDDQPRQELATGIPLNHAIRQYIKANA
jgi:hypothetical protein